MDCSACRGAFSESFDGRLDGVHRQEFLVHVRECGDCATEYALYRSVFSAIATLPDGEAPPFVAPSEVPGALTAAVRRSMAPRVARAAAGILLLVGLVGSHALVFQWSRDRAEGRMGVAPGATLEPVVAHATMVPEILPAALRDHVEATDLFIRTAAQSAQLPASAEAQDLAEADFATSNLAQLTADLRGRSYEHAANRHEVERIEAYLRAADEFVTRARRAVSSPARPSVRAICEAARQTGIVHHLEFMKPVVAPLQLGTAFATPPQVAPAVLRLSPDGQMIIESKRARLAGQLVQAADGFEAFEKRYPGSQLIPIARYLHQDALIKMGRFMDARQLSGARDFDQFSIRWVHFVPSDAAIRMAQTGQRSVIVFRIQGIPMKSEVLPPPLVEEPLIPRRAPAPVPVSDDE